MPNLPVNNPSPKLPPPAAVVLSETAQKHLLATVQKKVPAVTFTSIAPSELPSWYLLTSEEGSSFYTDKNANYLMMGMVIDINKWVVLDNQLDGTTSSKQPDTLGD